MKPETIRESVRLWEEQPEKAHVRPTVTARADGAQAALQGASFSWRADLPPTLGGSNQAPSPTLLLLGALAGCAVVFIRDTLGPQLGVRVDDVQATARCDADFRGLVGVAGAPADLLNVQLDVTIDSPDDEAQVQRLWEVWQERCPIYLALINQVGVSASMTVARA